ncbi:uncharacterized protein LOC111626815 [Centruroides sculpturatus]|uniref:uncharacterized protein LOC111626815 n=1 Tax=Centruroides sculpturatus TaxID=218467 RepID=UPI000C6E2100|nr:uncharacterized protein LOC111626815 [Centruroides sculpturatus]
MYIYTVFFYCRKYFLGSCDFQESEFSQHGLQSLDFSQVRSSQELFSDHFSQSEKEEPSQITTSINSTRKASLIEDFGKNTDEMLNVSKLLMDAKEKDEKVFLEKISHDIKEHSLKLSTLSEIMQKMVDENRNNKQKISEFMEGINKYLEKTEHEILLTSQNLKEIIKIQVRKLKLF